MKYNDLINSTCTEFRLSATVAKGITGHILNQIANSIRNGESVATPAFRIISRDVPERAVLSKVTGETKTIPSHKKGIIKLK
jgi:nucleoid DNA-binding protein